MMGGNVIPMAGWTSAVTRPPSAPGDAKRGSFLEELLLRQPSPPPGRWTEDDLSYLSEADIVGPDARPLPYGWSAWHVRLVADEAPTLVMLRLPEGVEPTADGARAKLNAEGLDPASVEPLSATTSRRRKRAAARGAAPEPSAHGHSTTGHDQPSMLPQSRLGLAATKFGLTADGAHSAERDLAVLVERAAVIFAQPHGLRIFAENLGLTVRQLHDTVTPAIANRLRAGGMSKSAARRAAANKLRLDPLLALVALGTTQPLSALASSLDAAAGGQR